MNTENSRTPARQAAVNGLAVVGFIALIIAGMALAVYSARFVPTIVNRAGTAAVYLGSLFKTAPDAGLTVVPTDTTSTTTITFGGSPKSETPEKTETPATVAKPSTPTAGVKTTTVYPAGGSGVLSGLSDLVVTVSVVGYLTTTSTDSFVASATVPDGERPAIKFTVKNMGTNVSGSWRFMALLPSRGDSRFESPLQLSLAPGESIDFTLGFDRAISGDQTISVTANFDGAIKESNTSNNTVSAKITIL